MLSPDVPPWDGPATVSVHSGRGMGTETHLAKPEKSGGAKLRDCRAALTTRQSALCSPDCNRQTRRNPATQRLGLPCGEPQNGSPPAGYVSFMETYLI